MTKLTNEELRKLLRQYAAAMYAYTVSEYDSDDEKQSNAKADEIKAEILQRMAEGAAGEASQGDLLAALKGYEQWEADLINSSEAWHNGGRDLPEITQELWDKLLALQSKRNTAIKNFESGSASTVGPRPRCPKCESGNIDFTGSRNFACCRDCHFYTNEGNFAQFFAAAPAKDASVCFRCEGTKTIQNEDGTKDVMCESCEGTGKTPAPEDVQLDVELEKRIAEIRERESKATKGPWKREGPNNGWGNNIAVCPIGDKEPAIYHCFAHPQDVIADADFIAHARQDIPFLLEQLALLRRVSGKGAQRLVHEDHCIVRPDEVPEENIEILADGTVVPSPAPVPATPKKRMMINSMGHIHEYCPDCRGTCSEYIPATTQGTPEGTMKITPPNYDAVAQEGFAKLDELASGGNDDPRPCPSCGAEEGASHTFECPEAQE